MAKSNEVMGKSKEFDYIYASFIHISHDRGKDKADHIYYIYRVDSV